MSNQPPMPNHFDAARVAEEIGPCVIWRGSISCGYGVVRYKGKMWRAHRAAWDAERGPIPPGMFVCHKCDTPACVNVKHLFLGTPKDNSDDMVRKGRSTKGLAGKVRLAGESNGRCKLSASQVQEVLHTKGKTRWLANKFGVDRTTIQKIRRGVNWKVAREAAEAAKDVK